MLYKLASAGIYSLRSQSTLRPSEVALIVVAGIEGRFILPESLSNGTPRRNVATAGEVVDGVADSPSSADFHRSLSKLILRGVVSDP
jgi:hypothetical protein